MEATSKAVNSGMPSGTTTFLTLLEPYNAPELIKAINNATSDDAFKAIHELKLCTSYLSRLLNEVAYCFIFAINFHHEKRSLLSLWSGNQSQW